MNYGLNRTWIAITIGLLLACCSLVRDRAWAAEDIGWLGQPLPSHVKRGAKLDEYIQDKTGLPLIYIPAGMCPSPETPYSASRPVFVPAFYISKFKVSVEDFERFVTVTSYETEAEHNGGAFVEGAPVPGKYWSVDPKTNQPITVETTFPAPLRQTQGVCWKSPGFPQEKNHPVTCVSWNDSKTYCQWANVSLPWNIEWTKAAFWCEREMHLVLYPWFGVKSVMAAVAQNQINFQDDFNADVRKIEENRSFPFVKDGYVYTSPIDKFPDGASCYGVRDMIGNTMEWTADSREREAPYVQSPKSIRGSSFRSYAWAFGIVADYPAANQARFDLGFRVVVRVAAEWVPPAELPPNPDDVWGGSGVGL